MTISAREKVQFKVPRIPILNADEKQLVEISHKLGIGLTIEEMQAVKKYFLDKKRNPTNVELQTVGQTWSEHCFHKTFKGEVTTKDSNIQSLFKTYITKPARELTPSWCISTFEDNAGIIEFNKEHAIAVKVETHNHPSAIEPFGGAATGVGGVIRDVLGVWADPICCTDVLGFGPLSFDYTKLPQGIKHPKYLFRGVVAGIGCYGNNMGIPTVNGGIFFDETYVGNVVVYCGCIGLLPKDKFSRNARPGDVILLVGGRTGRDGIHGVTFASAELTEESEEVHRPAVQIANPIEEEKLKRAIVKVRNKTLGSGITDLGGGGLSSAIGEMAHRYNCGARVKLENVPLKYEGMDPWEIYVSESQERMLLLIPKKNLNQTIEAFSEEEVEATPLGELTRNRVLEVTFRGTEVANLDIEFLFAPPRTKRVAKWRKAVQKEPELSRPRSLSAEIFRLLSSPTISSRENVVRSYDHEVKGNTVIKPLHGEVGGPNDAAVIKPVEDDWKGIVVSCGINPRYGKIDPYWMTASAIDEAIRNNVAVGGRRIALLDNFVWGSPEKPDRMGALVRACRACYRFAKEFETPFISGKDSLYNESPLGPVTPTILMTAIGIIPDVRRAISLDLKSSGNSLYIVGQTFAELGGSEYYRLKGFLGKSVPKVRVSEAKQVMTAIIDAIDEGCVRACHDLSEGGLAVAAAEMTFSSKLGIELWLDGVPRTPDVIRDDFILFSESNSRFLLEVPEDKKSKFEQITRHVPSQIIGTITEKRRLCIHGTKDEKTVDVSSSELLDAWKYSLGAEK